MSEHLIDKQSQQHDNNHPTDWQSYHQTDVQNDANEHKHSTASKQLLIDENMTFTRLSEKEIQQYAAFFETYVRKPLPTKPEVIEKIDLARITPSIDPALMSRLEKELIEELRLDDVPDTEEIILPDAPPLSDITNKDEDFEDLETLLYSGYLEDCDSLSDLFAEIVDNEKESISNYESSIFNANVQSIFDDSDEAVIFHDPHLGDLIFDDEFNLPDLPNLSDLELDSIDIPDLPVAPVIVNDVSTPFEIDFPPIPIVESTTPVAIIEIDEVDEKEAEIAPVQSDESITKVAINENDDLPEHVLVKTKKKKKLTLQFFDTILILIIIVVLLILIINLSDSLPFNLPFL